MLAPALGGRKRPAAEPYYLRDRWLRFLPVRRPGAFRYLPGQSGYNHRPRAALPLVKQVMRWLAADTDLWTDTTSWHNRATSQPLTRSLTAHDH